jgi:hypothetical protein
VAEGRHGLEAQNAPRTAGHAFAASQAAPIHDILPKPRVQAHIDPDRTAEGTDPALDAANGFRNHVSCGQSLATLRISAEEVTEHWGSQGGQAVGQF